MRYTLDRRLSFISVNFTDVIPNSSRPTTQVAEAPLRPNPPHPKPATRNLKLLFLVLLLALAPACTKLTGPKVIETGYVTANQVYLRDRLSEIYRKVGLVKNGEKIDVLEKSRRFVRVRTAAGLIGWLEQRNYITQEQFDQFQKFNKDSQALPVAAIGIVHSETNLHLTPGRDTDHLYQLAANSKIEILRRQVAEKTTAAPAPPPKKPAQNTKSSKDAKPGTQQSTAQPAPTPQPTPPRAAPLANAAPPILEDWWLVRDASGHAGWILGRAMDLDVPIDILQYAEGKRIIFAGILNTVRDPEQQEIQQRRLQQAANGGSTTDATDNPAPDPDKNSGKNRSKKDRASETRDRSSRDSATSTVGKDGNVPQFVVLFTDPKDGQPFDFNALRVFTWNTRHHRYENAWRERDLFGLLPASVGTQDFGKDGKLPIFTFHTAGADGKPVERKYRLNGVIVSRVLSPEEQAAKDADKAAHKAAAPAHTQRSTHKSRSAHKPESKRRSRHKKSR